MTDLAGTQPMQQQLPSLYNGGGATSKRKQKAASESPLTPESQVIREPSAVLGVLSDQTSTSKKRRGSTSPLLSGLGAAAETFGG